MVLQLAVYNLVSQVRGALNEPPGGLNQNCMQSFKYESIFLC